VAGAEGQSGSHKIVAILDQIAGEATKQGARNAAHLR